MNTIIQLANGATYDFEVAGITTRDFVVTSPSSRIYTELVQGRHGLVTLGSEFAERVINASFYAKASDTYDYALLRDEIFRTICSNRPFYLIESRNPSKRWHVRVANPFALEQEQLYGFFEVEFIADKGFAESIGTTLDPFTFDAEKWQVGQGLHDLMPTYLHNTNTFSIYNASDIEIDPRELPIKIKYQGASNKLSLTNTTTGDEWAYTGTSNTSDTILLDGIRSLKNGLTIFGQTNRKLITLAPGWNHFTLSGTSGSFSISFDFRFYYI